MQRPQFTLNPPPIYDEYFAATQDDNETDMNDGRKSLIDSMVYRFLGWKLPANFGPDAGISFKPYVPQQTPDSPLWPSGTNLFTVDQARAMFEHALGVKEASMEARKVEVTVGGPIDPKYYTVHFSETGEPVMVEASFYGYRGRLTFRPVKQGGTAWKRAVAAASNSKGE